MYVKYTLTGIRNVSIRLAYLRTLVTSHAGHVILFSSGSGECRSDPKPQLASSMQTITDSGDSDSPPVKERATLLPRATNPLAAVDGLRTVYGSDGEIDNISPRVAAVSVSENQLLIHSITAMSGSC